MDCVHLPPDPTWWEYTGYVVVVVAADEVKQPNNADLTYSNIGSCKRIFFFFKANEAQMCGIMRHKRCQPRLLQVCAGSLIYVRFLRGHQKMVHTIRESQNQVL